MSRITNTTVETQEVKLSSKASSLDSAAQRREVTEVETRVSVSVPPAFAALPSL